jgi:FtsZ-interacting cell division protein ZipA
MGKKIAIIIVIILLVITAVVYVGIWNAQKEKTSTLTPPQVPAVSTEQSASKKTENAKVEESAKSADSDVSTIEADLNSVSDDSFGENTLSDTEVGL